MRADACREQIGDQHRFVEPCGEQAIQHHDFELNLLDADRFEIGLVVETTGGESYPEELPAATLNGMLRQRAISFRISCLNSA